MVGENWQSIVTGRAGRRSAAIVVWALAAWLLTYTTDREFINLAPTPGVLFTVPLEAGKTYEQAFVVHRSTITRLGFFLQPLLEQLPAGELDLRVQQPGHFLKTLTIASPFIDSAGFTQIRLRPPLRVQVDQPVVVQWAVPEALSGKVGVQTRQVDWTFNNDDAIFSVDGRRQVAPLAYQAYFLYRPALAVVLAVLLLIGGLVLWLPHLPHYWPRVVALLVGVVAVLPALLLGAFPCPVLLAVCASWFGMFRLLQRSGVRPVGAVIGAQAASLTSYYALQAQGGRPSLLLFSLLPLVLSSRFGRAVRLAVVLIIVAAAFALLPESEVILKAAPVRDIFFDPYQVASSLKLTNSELPWHHFGSYLGLLSFTFAALGLVTHGRHFTRVTALLVGSLVLTQYGGRLLWGVLPLSPAYAVIITTLCLSWFCGWGAEALARYLGSSYLARFLMCAVGLLALLDLLLVLGTTWETFYL